MLSGTTLVCAFLCSASYVVATFFMKYLGGHSLLIVLPAVGVALMAGAIFEIEALKTAEVARTFVVIIALEFTLTLVCAIVLFGERYSLRDFFAVVLVFAGIALLTLREREAAAVIAGSTIAMGLAEKPQADEKRRVPPRLRGSQGRGSQGVEQG